MAVTCRNCAKCGEGFKIGTNQAYNIEAKISTGGILKIFCLCSYTNMAASDKGISLKRKVLTYLFLTMNDVFNSILDSRRDAARICPIHLIYGSF